MLKCKCISPCTGQNGQICAVGETYSFSEENAERLFNAGCLEIIGQADEIELSEAETAKIEADRVAAEKAEAERLDAEKAALDAKVEADRLQAEKDAADAAEIARLDAEDKAIKEAAAKAEADKLNQNNNQGTKNKNNQRP